MIDPFVAWLLALMLQFVPPDRSLQVPSHPETVQQRTDRYRDIARDIRAVVFDPETKVLPGLTRRKTAALVLAVAIGESGLARDVDLGPCYREGPKWVLRCDSGIAVGLWQVQIPLHQQAPYWLDRQLLLRLAYKKLRQSFRLCRHLAPCYRLAAYGSGSCDRGRKLAASRWGLFRRLLRARPLPRAAGDS